MTFEEKVKFLRNQPEFKVAPINEVRAVAFAAKESNENAPVSFNNTLFLTQHDVDQILHEYPHLENVLK